MTSTSIELNKVFNFSINNLNKKYKSIYLIINRNTNVNDVITELTNVKVFSLTPEFKSILNNILIKEIKETLITITIKKQVYNLHITLFNNESSSSLILFHSLIKNKIRNINLLTIGLNIYNFLNNFLVTIYNYDISNNNLNFYFNLLNNNLDEQIIKNNILDIKSLYMCKHNIDIDLSKVVGVKEEIASYHTSKFKYYQNKPKKIDNTYVLYTSNKSKLESAKIINTLKIVLINNISKQTNNKIILVPEPFDNFTLKYFGRKCIYIDYSSLSTDNNILYSKNTPIELINKIFDSITNNSLPITILKSDDKKNINHLHFNIKNECILLKLLSSI